MCRRAARQRSPRSGGGTTTFSPSGGDKNEGRRTYSFSGAAATVDYNKFTHKAHAGSVKVPGTQQTRELKCDYCHDRTVPPSTLVASPERNKKIQLDFPQHRSCIECKHPVKVLRE